MDSEAKEILIRKGKTQRNNAFSFKGVSIFFVSKETTLNAQDLWSSRSEQRWTFEEGDTMFNLFSTAERSREVRGRTESSLWGEVLS